MAQTDYGALIAELAGGREKDRQQAESGEPASGV